ncbi:MAG: pectate lyase [Marinilabiliaceae bacterium]
MKAFNRFVVCGVALLASLTVAAQAPAFPGAEGYARYAVTGGRGGKVIHVTNLKDSGTGSLRAALNQSGKRIIVFDVSGYIDLASDLVIKNGDVTIAGQTAPEPGITLRYYTVQNKASNVVMRFIRIRRSQVKDVNEGADATWGRECKNIILDHCSFSWSIDETASYYDNRDFTMQWCSVSESLNNAGHGKGAHGYGGIWGGKGASFHHNLIAHHNNRTPRINSARYAWDGYDKDKYANTVVAERVDFRNCVIYNWGTANGAYGNMGGYLNIVGNYYKAGPATKNKTRVFQCSVDDGKNKIEKGTMGQFFISGNYMASVDKENYDWSGVITDGSSDFTFTDAAGYYGTAGAKLSIKLGSEVDADVVDANTTTHSAQEAFGKVLSYVGASLYRDDVDARHAEEARTGTATFTGSVGKGIVDMVNDPDATADATRPSFPALTSASRPAGFDTDGDGMPDAWERANGLDPNDASDGAAYTIDGKKFYTNVEVYINSLVEDIVKAQNADALSAVDEYYPSFRATALPAVSVEAEIIGFEYYSLSGKRLAEPANGISVRRTLYAGGSSSTDLVIKK